MAEESSTKKPESFKYRNQADRYAGDKDALIGILDSFKSTTDNVEELLSTSYTDVKNDFFTSKIEEGNGNIVGDIEEIKSKLESVASSLKSKAIELDREDNRANNESSDETV